MGLCREAILLENLMLAMTAYDRGDAKRIQHFTKVHSYAALIAAGEGFDSTLRLTTQAAAIVHDVGIHLCEQKYGRCDGKLQEKEGPAPARALLEAQGFAPAVTDRVCWLVGHHHTYAPIGGPDHQVLVEADLLVNLYEDAAPPEAVRAAYERIFKTGAGRALCRDMFGLQDGEALDGTA